MSADRAYPPIFATNRPARGQTVADEVLFMLRTAREQLKEAPELAIATAYLNADGFNLLADEIKRSPAVRLLIGAEPQRTDDDRRAGDDVLDFIEYGLTQERDLTGFTVEADRAARRLVEWLRVAAATGKPRVEVRRYRKAFLHGKAFIATHPTHPVFLAGSSNFTRAGLTTNHELNLGYPQGAHTDLVIDWFDELWAEAEDFDLAGFYAERWQEHTPWSIFLRMLAEFYRDEDAGGAWDFGLPLTGFQRDGVARALRLLEELGGVLVCDEVGLGKTFIAGEIIHQASKRDRQRVIVIAPAALIDSTWKPFLDHFDLTSSRVSVVSYDDLRLGVRRELQHPDEYALVVIDEAHNLRNPDTQRADALKGLMRGAYPKKLVLLTATPVNNSLYDLETLISYFVPNDAHFAAIGIPSVAEYIKEAQRLDPMTLSPEHLFDLMNQVAVRRTRGFIKREYVGETLRGPNGEEIAIEFPEPQLHRIDYDLSTAGAQLLDDMVYALEDPLVDADPPIPLIERLLDRCTDPQRLSMARYMPRLFALGDPGDEGEHTISVYRQISATGLLESILLKRLESSPIALRNTLSTMIRSHEAFLKALDHNVVLTGRRLVEFDATEDNLLEFLEELDAETDRNVEPASDYDVDRLRAAAEQDLVRLEELRAQASAAAEAGDPKVFEIVERLREVAADAERPSRDGVSSSDRRKVIVFSTYADTIQHLREQVAGAIASAPKGDPLLAYAERIPGAVFGSSTGVSQQHRANVIAGFAPATAGPVDHDGNPLAEDAFDVLFATDVLSEGVNLQQAGRIISADLPWNPMRLVQRHGRIDRIGSHHRHVDIDCFFPATDLERLLGLEARLQRKVAYANAALGMGKVLPGQIADPTLEVTLADTLRQIEEIRNEDATILNSGGTGALSGEEYRRRLDKAMGDARTKRQVLGLPFGSGSGFVSPNVHVPGWVFCARIGDHREPWFRFVAADAAGAVLQREDDAPWIVDETLRCLVAADPMGPGTEFDVTDAMREHVFDAWAAARDDIYASWMWLTDTANIQPSIPKALREGILLVHEHGSALGLERQQELSRQLNAVWDKRVVDEVRLIVRADESPARRLARLTEFVEAEGLDPPPPAKPLDPVDIDDIRVVCWMAVRPAFSSTTG